MTKVSTFIGTICLFLSLGLSAQSSMNMTLLGTWDGSTSACVYGGVVCYNEVWGYADGNGNEFAIICSPEEVHFIDVTDPTNPTLVQTFKGTGRSIWRDVKSFGNYVYVVHDNNETNDSEGLWVFNVSNIGSGSIQDLGFFENDFKRAHNIFIDEQHQRLYVAGSNTEYNGLIVYDISGGTPQLITSVQIGAYIHDLYVRDHIAYLSLGNSGLYVFDMTNPNSPQYMDDFTGLSGYNHSSWGTEDNNYLVTAYETSDKPLVILDISNPSNMTYITQFKYPLLAPNHTDNIAHNPLIKGDYAYVSYYEDGVEIFDISDPNNPTIAGYYDMVANSSYNGTDRGAWGVYPFLPSGHILVSDDLTGLYVLQFDLLTPPPPTCTPDFPSNITVSIPSATSATISWDPVPDAEKYQVRYKLKNSSTWITEGTFGTSKTITGLTASQLYEYRVRTFCGDAWGEYSPLARFFTATCPYPENITFSQYPNGDHRLEWDAVTGATKYQVRYREVGSSNWEITGTLNTFKRLVGLNYNTTYDFRVRSLCP